MSAEEVEILRRRAETFLKYAKEALERGDYDLAAFAGEQAAQLYLKSVALELVGEVPRTHRVRELLHLLGKAVPELEEPAAEFAARNREALRALEDAYIASRYLPSTYERDEAEALVRTAESLIEFAREALRKCRR